MKLYDADEIYVEFLRAEISEVTRIGYNARHTNTSESFDGDGSEDTFELSNTQVQCINSVTVDGVIQTKYLNYDIDLNNNKIVFKSGSIPGAGTDNVVVDYDYNAANSSWIYPDKPRQELTKSQYPRIGVMLINNPGESMGIGESDRWHSVKIQVDILTIKGLKATINSETFEGQDLVNYIASQVIKKTFDENSKIKNKLEVLELLQNYPMPFNEETNQFRRVLSFSFQGKNVGDVIG